MRLLAVKAVVLDRLAYLRPAKRHGKPRVDARAFPFFSGECCLIYVLALVAAFVARKPAGWYSLCIHLEGPGLCCPARLMC